MVALVPVVAASAAAVLSSLAIPVARNMLQTAAIRKEVYNTSHPHNLESLWPAPPPTTTTTSTSNSTSSVTEQLRAMNRGDLLRIFSQSRAPTPSELDRWFSSCHQADGEEMDEEDPYDCNEWDAIFLDNNGRIMNAVPLFITHYLFGGIALPWRLLSRDKGKWTGKAFSRPSHPNAGGRGTNVFSSSSDGDDRKQQQQRQRQRRFRRHQFDYIVTKSEIFGDNYSGDTRSRSRSRSLRLDYASYQSLPISLWSSMHDELRVVEPPPSRHNKNDNEEGVVLLGMGWMGWSGGPVNCSPFLIQKEGGKHNKSKQQ